MRGLVVRGALFLGLLAIPAAGVVAQLPGLAKQAAPSDAPAAAPQPAATPEPEAPDSPRAAARAFVELTTRRGDYAGAARYLAVPPADRARAPELARRLRAVLERQLDIDIDALSPEPEGSLRDGLPDGVDAVGRLPDGRGGEVPIFMVRVRDAQGTRWAFSSQTVARIDGWYDALPDRWIRDSLPEQLQRYGPLGVTWWQWLALPALAAMALAVGRVIGALAARLLQRVFRRTPTAWDDALLERTAPALTLLVSVAAAALLLPFLALRPGVHASLRALLSGVASLGAFWALWRAVDVWALFLNERPWARENPSARSLLAVTRNLARVFVAITGVVATLAVFGYPVATVLAGLGIGGIAVAFGAQKTIENLFGSIALAADQPFRVGDFVRIGDFTGNVERIGLRSTQVRTLDRTLVSLPNGKLADMQIEDFAARDRIRFATTLGLVYGTSEEQLLRVVDGVRGVLRASPRVWPETVVSAFAGFSASSLDVEVMCWFETGDYNEFRELRQQALVGILRVVRESGTSFAFPTTTLHVSGSPPTPAKP